MTYQLVLKDVESSYSLISWNRPKADAVKPWKSQPTRCYMKGRLTSLFTYSGHFR